MGNATPFFSTWRIAYSCGPVARVSCEFGSPIYGMARPPISAGNERWGDRPGKMGGPAGSKEDTKRCTKGAPDARLGSDKKESLLPVRKPAAGQNGCQCQLAQSVR